MPPPDSSSIATVVAICSCHFPFSIFHLQYECVGGWKGGGRALCNGTQSDNWRLRIFAFCVNFHGKIIDALACQGFSMAAYLLKLWFLARFAARCSLLLAVSLFIVCCLQNMKQCMEKTLILWLSKTISTAKAAATTAAATAATFSAVHWPLGAGACNFVYLCFEFELPNAKSVQFPLPSPHSRQLHAMTRIRCTFHSYFLRLTPAWSQAKPRRGGVSGFIPGFLAGIFKPHHTRFALFIDQLQVHLAFCAF